MKSGPEFEQCCHAAVHADCTAVGWDQRGNQIQQGAFARPICADYGQALPMLHLKGYALQGIELFNLPAWREHILKMGPQQKAPGVPMESLPDVAEFNDVRGCHR